MFEKWLHLYIWSNNADSLQCSTGFLCCSIQQANGGRQHIRAALSKRVQLPSTSASTVSELNADCLAVYNEPRKKTRKSNVEKLLLGEGFRKYSGELKATVNFMIRHCEVLDENLRRYYESVGTQGGPSLSKAMERVRRLHNKNLSKESKVN